VPNAALGAAPTLWSPPSALRSSPVRNRIGRHGMARPSSFRLTSRAQEVALTSRQDFTDEEWARIRRAPLVAGVAISLADPGGPIEVAKETVASLRSATLPPSQEELLAAVALDVQALAQQRQNPLGDFKPRSGQQVLEELRAVNELVTAKATTQEAEAFRRWLVATAQAAADAAKEGGFMGFGAEQVSAGEKQMLDQVRAALGVA
jgi:hypothetical protein